MMPAEHKRSMIDGVIAIVAPAYAAKRVEARLRLEVVEDAKRKYEAASTTRRMAKWNASKGSANVETAGGLRRVRDRARDLVRNTAWAARAVRALVTRLVGSGVRARIEAGAVKDAWIAWAETTACDVEGRRNLYGIQRTAIRCLIESGEVLIRRKVGGDGPIPLRIQVLEPDFLDDWRLDGATKGGGRIIQGVEFDKEGRRIAYHLFRDHPGDAISGLETDRVPASEILHIFSEDRAGQVRGMPWGHSAFVRLRQLDETVDAELMRRKVGAALVGFVRDLTIEPIAVDQGTDGEPGPVVDLEPGTFEHLGAGKTIEFSKPPSIDGYREFATEICREVAQGFGTTYEAMTGDYSQVNFTSGRMGSLEWDAEIDQNRSLLVEHALCGGVFGWFAEIGHLAGAFGPGAERPTCPRWIHAGRKMLDPAREITASVAEIRSGLTTLTAKILETGEDPDEVLAEHERDDAKLDELDLTLDCDPRRIAASAVNNPAAAAPPEDAAAGAATKPKPAKGE